MKKMVFSDFLVDIVEEAKRRTKIFSYLLEFDASFLSPTIASLTFNQDYPDMSTSRDIVDEISLSVKSANFPIIYISGSVINCSYVSRGEEPFLCIYKHVAKRFVACKRDGKIAGYNLPVSMDDIRDIRGSTEEEIESFFKDSAALSLVSAFL
ncbi:MAG: hypothetical protein GY861_21845 [bacterium]|nr:hypothetical protein [bacterium]